MATGATIGEPLKSAVGLYDVEYRQYHLEQPGFRINEMKLSATQTVPWHTHSKISDTFYVIEGEMRLFLQQPKESLLLGPGDSYKVVAGRPHLVTNAGDASMHFLVLQGVGEYDFVPMV